MFMDNLDWGLVVLIHLAPVAFIVVCLFHGIKFLIKRKIDFSFKYALCETLWVLFILAILHVTGIIEAFNQLRLYGTSAFVVHMQFNLIPFEEGINMATILNIILFIPFGFFSAIVFKNARIKMKYIILMGFMFSFCIEIIQAFCGRNCQTDDVIMNTLGTFIGYQVCIYLLTFKEKIKSIIYECLL